jgi:MGT family glycosyltransferase
MPDQGPGPFTQVSSTLERLLEFTSAVLGSHLEQVRQWRPNLIMYDSFAPWGRIIAQYLRLPSVASVPSILINGEIDRQYGARPGMRMVDPGLTPQWYASFQTRLMAALLPYNLPEYPTPTQLLQSYGDLNLVYTSRLFQPLAEAFPRERFRFVGPCFQFRPDAPAFPLERLDDRPLVLISLGTVYGDKPEFLRTCLEELAGAPWQVVLSTGGGFPAEELAPVPENFIVRSFVPQIEILRRSTAFVTHGGMNSVQEALYYGVPMVMTPQAADQFWISARVAELGAGLVLDPAAMRAGDLRRSVAEILRSPGFAASAAKIGASLHGAGAHRKAADAVQSLAGASSIAPLQADAGDGIQVRRC